MIVCLQSTLPSPRYISGKAVRAGAGPSLGPRPRPRGHGLVGEGLQLRGLRLRQPGRPVRAAEAASARPDGLQQREGRGVGAGLARVRAVSCEQRGAVRVCSPDLSGGRHAGGLGDVGEGGVGGGELVLGALEGAEAGVLGAVEGVAPPPGPGQQVHGPGAGAPRPGRRHQRRRLLQDVPVHLHAARVTPRPHTRRTRHSRSGVPSWGAGSDPAAPRRPSPRPAAWPGCPR